MSKKNQEEFISAVSNRKFKEASILIAKGIDIDGLVDGSCALHYCARSSKRQVQWLMEQGANINILSQQDLTPLMIACGKGGKICEEIACLLIDSGANTLFRRDDGISALEFAAKSCSASMIEKLLKAGAKINGPRNAYFTPAMAAARANNVESLRALVESNADLSLKCRLPWAKGKTCLELAEMERRTKVVTYLRSIGLK